MPLPLSLLTLLKTLIELLKLQLELDHFEEPPALESLTQRFILDSGCSRSVIDHESFR
jgi:hypothetical protein